MTHRSMQSVQRYPRAAAGVLVAGLGLAISSGEAFADANDLPACADFPAPTAEWTRAEENGFALALPPGAQAVPRTPSLDHEFGQWNWSDGRALQFQYGFAVTELADWVDDPDVVGCQGDLDGVRAVYLQRSRAGEPRVFAIGLFDYVQSYTVGFGLGDNNPTQPNDLAIIGQGADDSIFEQGKVLFDSFRWSRLPESALAAWTVQGAPGNGVLVFETNVGAPALMFATYRDGKPFWLVGNTPGQVASYRQQEVKLATGDATTVSVPMTLHETSGGSFPGEPVQTPQVTKWADAELIVSLSDGCTIAELRWQRPEESEIEVITLVPTYPLLHGCSPYRR